MVKYIKFYLRFSKLILLGVVTLTVYLGTRASKLNFDFTMERLFLAEGPDRDNYEGFQNAFGDDGSVLYVAFKSPRALSGETLGIVEDLTRLIQNEVPHVRAVYSIRNAREMLEKFKLPSSLLERELQENPLFQGTLVSRDGKTACLWVMLESEAHSEERRTTTLRALNLLLLQEQEKTGLEFFVAGLPVIEHEYAALSRRDLSTFLTLAVCVLLLLLGVYFRNLMGTFLPLVTVLVAVTWTLGGLYLLHIPLGMLTGSVPTLLLVVCISDSIHVLSRYEEDLSRHPEKREALAWTLLTMVGACFLTSVTSSIGFVSLATADVAIIREFGLVTAGGIMIAYVVTVLFVPAVLDNLPPFRPRVLAAFAEQVSDRILIRLARLNDAGRWVILSVAGGILLLSILGTTQIRRDSSWLQDLPEKNRVRQAHEFFRKNLGSVFTLDVVIDAPEGARNYFATRPALEKVDEFSRRLSEWKWTEDPETKVSAVYSFSSMLREVNRAVAAYPQAILLGPLGERALRDEKYRKLPTNEFELNACLALMRRSGALGGSLPVKLVTEDFRRCRLSVRIENLSSRSMEAFRTDLDRAALDVFGLPGGGGKAPVFVTGKSWMAAQAESNIMMNMLSSLFLAGLLICTAMSVLFRSIRIGLLSMVPNIIPIFVTAGFMGLVGIRLNFSTVTVYSISLGLAVDNTIHYLARFRLELLRDGSHRRAMYRTLRHAGRPMIFAGVLFMLGFSTLLYSNFRFTFYFGLLGGFTVLVALLCDLFITPTIFLVFKPKAGRWDYFESKWKEFDERISKLFPFSECAKGDAGKAGASGPDR